MVVINPWMYMNATVALLEIAVVMASKASTYLLQSLQRSLQQEGALGNDQNSTTELTEQVFQMSELAIEQLFISPNLAKFFIFRLNPNKLDRHYSKIRTNTISGAGLIMDTYGNQGITYSYSGTMGNMRPALGLLRLPQLTAAWHNLYFFKKFFLDHDQDLIFVLDDEACVGRFDSFDFGLDASNPWLINYRFQITAYPDTEFNLLDGFVGAAFNAIKGTATFVIDPFATDLDNESSIEVFDDTYGIKHAQELYSL